MNILIDLIGLDSWSWIYKFGHYNYADRNRSNHMNDHQTEKEESGSLLSIDTESLIFGSDPPENQEKVRVPQFNCKDDEPTPE